MRNIFYSSVDFHRAIKRNSPKKVYSHQMDIWFYTQKAVLIYRPVDDNDRFVMIDWLVNQGVKVDGCYER